MQRLLLVCFGFIAIDLAARVCFMKRIWLALVSCAVTASPARRPASARRVGDMMPTSMSESIKGLLSPPKPCPAPTPSMPAAPAGPAAGVRTSEAAVCSCFDDLSLVILSLSFSLVLCIRSLSFSLRLVDHFVWLKTLLRFCACLSDCLHRSSP
jgi:hypothetical protein